VRATEAGHVVESPTFYVFDESEREALCWGAELALVAPGVLGP
jgi:hypothetical protein